MNSARRRLALLSGAALSAYAFSTPVEAATNPGILHWVSDANVDDELVSLVDQNVFEQVRVLHP